MTQVGFFTDTTLCIGCKACEVACKQWNQLPDDGFNFTGMSLDNTAALGASTWRHVSFIERDEALPGHGSPYLLESPIPQGLPPVFSWLMMSDVCKHCDRAGCLEQCPTGAIVRTELGTVFVQPDICNGCGYCIPACPFGVIARDEKDGRASKCTLCYDRLKDDLTPACAKSCPTSSIQFGDLVQLRIKAEARVQELQARGVSKARLYGEGAASQPGTQGLHAFFLICDEPETYNLPPDPRVPTLELGKSWRAMAVGVLGVAALALGAVFSARGTR